MPVAPCGKTEIDRTGHEGAFSASRQEAVNHRVYESPDVYRYYASLLLTPSEIACLLKYQPYIAGRDVLDVGVGTGRTTRYLAPVARRYVGIDYSSVMVCYMKGAMPAVTVQHADFRNLEIFDNDSFDFVFAPNNVIDSLSHEGRLQALGEARRVLRFGGVFAFSSHNIRYKGAFSGPQLNWSNNPVRLASNCFQYGLCWRNYLRLAPLRRSTPEYAVLNDPGHYYACLHYYVSRSTVDSQLAHVGLKLNEVFDAVGQVTPETSDDSENASLLYVAERVGCRLQPR